MENFLQGKPWSFDRHIVILQRYEIDTFITNLSFDKVSLWVQVHDILVRYLNWDVAKKLCELVDEVDRTPEILEVEGGSFIGVRVRVDVNLPLCQGCMFSIEDSREGWVSFKYERLPNICYWCRRLNHVDRDCDL